MNQKPKIVIIDYGMGNIHSVARALQAAAPDASIVLSNQKQSIRDASHLILPGQGAMPDCMQALEKTNLIDELLLQMQQKPSMGICVGMQMLFEHSAEGNTKGLGVLKGQIEKFPDFNINLNSNINSDFNINNQRIKVPHMGWNKTHIEAHHQNHKLWSNQTLAEYFYFVHSYYLPLSEYGFTRTHYGLEFSSSVLHEQIFATQFHPEKSGVAGLALYKKFIEQVF